MRPNQPPKLLANVLGDGGAGELASASAEVRLTFTDATEPPLPEAPGMELLSVGDAAFLRADTIQLTAVARVGTGSAPDVLFGFAIGGGRAVLAAGEGDGLRATRHHPPTGPALQVPAARPAGLEIADAEQLAAGLLVVLVVLFFVLGGGVTLNKLSANQDFFAPAQYFQMDDGKKLSSAGFEQRQSG